MSRAMSATSQLSVVSLAKLGLRDKLTQMRANHRLSGRVGSIAEDSALASTSVSVLGNEMELMEDLPPSYASVSHHDVDEMSTKESIFGDFVITNQPRSNSSDSLELSTRSSLQSTKLSMDVQLLSNKTGNPLHRRPGNQVGNAWNDNIVIRNIYHRDQMSFLCFCASTLGGIAGLAFYCTS